MPKTKATMIQFRLFQILFAPVSLLYGIGVLLRNLFYRIGILKQISFNFPVISVGNLSMGGSGKTPHIEYLVRLLKDYIQVATLSRGYKRQTTGFLLATPTSTAAQIGDEPLQFARKFPDITVAVGESRAFGIPQILSFRPETQTILLDDAFQHLAVKPGLNIMLTDWQRPFTRDFLLPSGRLREWRAAYKRADMIIVSKCPADLTLDQKQALLKEINPFSHQQVFFSTYGYRAPYYLLNPAYLAALDKEMDVVLLSGIANPQYLVQYLESRVRTLIHVEYPDHHYFDTGEIHDIKAKFQALESGRKIVLTTEKDAMRLELHRNLIYELQIPIFVLPIEVYFLFHEGVLFDEAIKTFLLDFKV